jgi:phenylacetate-CoA ligase
VPAASGEQSPGMDIAARLHRFLLVRPHERVLLAIVALARAATRHHLGLFLLGARHGGGLLSAAGGPAAVRSAVRAYRRVPAYRAFLDARGGLPVRPAGMATADWLARLPVTGKRSYVDVYPIAERCVDGRMPARGVEVDESSGSSGTPYQWVRTQAELEHVHVTLALVARYILGQRGGLGRSGQDRPLVTLNAFSMGAWSTGTNVSAALKRIGAIKSCGPEPEKVLAALELFGSGVRYAVCGYPPFLQQLVRAAEQRGIDLTRYNLVGFVGGEGMGEGLRAELERTFGQVWSACGASDLDIGVATETPLSVWLRRAAAADPVLAVALFGRADRLPMIFQYDPSTYHIETVSAELVVTVLRKTLTPKLRYSVGDAGGVLTLRDALAIARAHGLDPETETARTYSTDYGAPLDLPLLYLHGRADSTISFMGSNLYPEDVEAGLDDAADPRIGTFCLELAGDQDPHPLIHVELAGAEQLSEPDADQLQAALAAVIRARLTRNSADYRAALAEDPRAARIVIELHVPGTGPFAVNSTRIKRRYLLNH